MSDKTVSIAIKTTADTAGAKATSAALEKVEGSAKKATKATDEGGKGMGKAGMLANQASFQVGDFFTQVEMGTSITRAFSQQAPQLIGAISSAGLMSAKAAMMFAGVGAAIPLLTMALPLLSGAFFGTAKAASTSAEDIGKAADKIADRDVAKINQASEALKAGIANAAAMEVSLSGVTAASNAYRSAAIDNAAAEVLARNSINVMFGATVDKYRQLREAQKLQADQRNEMARQEMAAQQADLAKREADLLRKEGVLRADIQKAEAIKVQIHASYAKMGTLQQNQAQLKDASKARPSIMDWSFVPSKASGEGSFDDLSARKSKADEADANLVGYDEQIGAVAKSIEKLKDELKALTTQESGAIDKQTATVKGARDQLEADRQEIATNLARLAGTLRVGKLTDDVENVKQTSATLADDLTAAMGRIQVNDARLIATKDTILQAAANKELTLAELDKIAPGMSQLTSALTSGIATTDGNVKTLINIMESYRRAQESLAAQIRNLAATRPK